MFSAPQSFILSYSHTPDRLGDWSSEWLSTVSRLTPQVNRNVILSPPTWTPVAILAEAFIWQLKVQCQDLVLGLHYMWSFYFELLVSLYYPLSICMSFLTNYILSILITGMGGFFTCTNPIMATTKLNRDGWYCFRARLGIIFCIT